MVHLLVNYLAFLALFSPSLWGKNFYAMPMLLHVLGVKWKGFMKITQSPDSEVLGDVKITEVEEPSLVINVKNFQFELGKTYRGMTASLIADVAPYKIDGVYHLADGTVLYETSDPRVRNAWIKGFFLLKEDGFYYLGGFSSQGISVVVDPVHPSFISLPLYVGKKFNRTVREFVILERALRASKFEKRKEKLHIRFTKFEGEVMAQYHIKVKDEERNCLLLRDYIRNHVTKCYTNRNEEYDYSVLLDRYIGDDGLLHLEHIWYCQDGGAKSMSEERARMEAKALFKRTSYAGKEWYRVHGHVMVKGDWIRYP